MSDYFARAAARADPSPAPQRPASPAPGVEVGGLPDEVELLEGEGTRPDAPARTPPPIVEPGEPRPWPRLSWDAEPSAPPSPGTVDDRPVEVSPAPDPVPARHPDPSQTADSGAWPVPTVPAAPIGDDEAIQPPAPSGPVVELAPADASEVVPQEPPAGPGDPLALADAVMAGLLEPPAAVVPQPEPRTDDAPEAGAPAPTTVVIDRLTVELVDDRPAAPAPARRRSAPRPAGRLAAARRFDSGWGW